MNPALPDTRSWHPLISLALAEDLGAGDATSQAVIPDAMNASARIEARAPLRVCGLPVATAVFQMVDPSLRVEAEIAEGSDTEARPMLRIHGSLRAILAGERTALNFLGRLCGIATLTRRYCAEIEGLDCRVVDTRKTLPGWRSLDKYATAVGGAENHRMGLYDALLLKDNHLATSGGAAEAFRRARGNAPSHLRIQVEVESEADADAAIAAGADWLLLDNCDLDTLTAVAKRHGDTALLEASGGVNLDRVRAIAATGVHRVSVGALTHSAIAADVALEIDRSG